MIIATGAVNIDENTKLAQEAQTNAEKTTDDKVKAVTGQFDSALEGKITQSIYEPGQVDDPHDHKKGDLWVVVDQGGPDGLASKMYTYDGSNWVQTKWDKESMSIENLSALNENVGSLHGGSIEGTFLYGKNLVLDVNSDNGSYDAGHNPQSWTGKYSDQETDSDKNFGVNWDNGLLHINAINNSDNYYDATYIGPDDIKTRKTLARDPGSGLLGRVDINNNGIVISSDWSDYSGVFLHADGTAWFNGGFDTGQGIKSGGTKNGYQENNAISATSGTDIYFHNKADATMDIHCGDVLSHGNKITSTLSSKRNIEDVNTATALAKINTMNIKRWQYKTDDNQSNHIGPIIDDVNTFNDKQFNTPYDFISTSHKETTFDESNALSIALAAIQELTKRNDELSIRVTKLEMERDNTNAK